MDTKKLLVIGVVAVLAVAAVGIAFYYTQNDKEERDPMGLTWDEILEEANGQRVNMGFYADAACQDFLDQYLIPQAKALGITVTTQLYGVPAANLVKEEMDNGKTKNGTLDLIWGDISPMAVLIPNGEYKYAWDQSFVGKIPNSKYLTDSAEDMAIAGINGYKPGTAMEFSNGQTMFVYSVDFNVDTIEIDGENISIPWNCIVLLEDGDVIGFLKVNIGGETFTGTGYIAAGDISSTEDLISALESADAYDLTDVRDFFDNDVKGKVLYGLPSDYTELASWIQIYDQQFTYPDPANAAATFHSNLVFQAIIYEMTWADANAKTGWRAAADRDANVKAVNDLINGGTIKTDADFKAHFGYLFNYLETIEPYTNKEIGHVTNGKYIGEINGKVVGAAATDKDFSDSTVMIGMTTVTSVDMRQSAYSFNIGTFSMDTGAKSQYYMTIPANSSHKNAALVVMNLFLEPQNQAAWFKLSGNGYNIDVTLKMDGDTQTIYEKYFVPFTKDWTLFLSQARLAEVTVLGIITGHSQQMITAWTAWFKSLPA